MTPIKLLVKRLSRRWNAEDALVVADWCEEYELTQFAWGIRRGVIDTLDHHVRTEVNRLAWAMGVRAHDVDELDWRRPDHKRVLRTLGCCGLEWRSRALSRSVTRPPRNPDALRATSPLYAAGGTSRRSRVRPQGRTLRDGDREPRAMSYDEGMARWNDLIPLALGAGVVALVWSQRQKPVVATAPSPETPLPVPTPTPPTPTETASLEAALRASLAALRPQLAYPTRSARDEVTFERAADLVNALDDAGLRAESLELARLADDFYARAHAPPEVYEADLRMRAERLLRLGLCSTGGYTAERCGADFVSAGTIDVADMRALAAVLRGVYGDANATALVLDQYATRIVAQGMAGPSPVPGGPVLVPMPSARPSPFGP